MISLYFHIPFCSRKCDYCHFYVLPDKPHLKALLMEGLKLEWESVQPLLSKKELVSIYFGGGTPYLLGAALIGEILQWVSSVFDLNGVEITLEANPENMEASSLKEFYAVGINRLSIGLQSLDDDQLITLSRRHTSNRGVEAVMNAYAVGFRNISIDLMYDLPNQTYASWQRSVRQAAALPITHLSLYNLTIEPHTLFFKKQELLKKQLPDGETSKAMYEFACDHLQENGLMQYEISAFAKDGKISQHNSGYWLGRPFLGFGPSAFSYWDDSRYSNCANLSRYVQKLQAGSSPVDFTEKLSDQARKRELFIIGIRLLQGVDLAAFQKKHGSLDLELFDILEQLSQAGFVELTKEHCQLTKRGILFYDYVASEVVMD